MSEININSSPGDLDPEKIYYEAGDIVMREQDVFIQEYADLGITEIEKELKAAAPQPKQTDRLRPGDEVIGYGIIIGLGFLASAFLTRRGNK